MKTYQRSTVKITAIILAVCFVSALLLNNKLLQWGIGTNNNTAIKLALSLGANPHSIQGFNGMTTLMFAAFEGNNIAVKALIEQGASISITDDSGQNVFVYAILGDDMDTIKTIADLIVDINKPYVNDVHYIQLAVWRNNPQLVALLLEYGADPNTTSNAAIPPIVFSEFYQYKEVSALLLNSGASTDRLEELLILMHEALDTNQDIMNSGLLSNAPDVHLTPTANSPAIQVSH